jgi:HEPN domain-containing protein
MLDTDDIQERIEALYAGSEGPAVEVPLGLQAVEFVYFARDYIDAAGLLEATPQYWLPRVQLTGQAVELALKGCLASANVAPPNDHDLAKLYREIEREGFSLEAPMFAAIVHLQHFYFEDLATKTKYKSRYPTRQTERLGGAVPRHAMFVSIVESLAQQVTTRV